MKTTKELKNPGIFGEFALPLMGGGGGGWGVGGGVGVGKNSNIYIFQK